MIFLAADLALEFTGSAINYTNSTSDTHSLISHTHIPLVFIIVHLGARASISSPFLAATTSRHQIIHVEVLIPLPIATITASCSSASAH